MYGPVVIAACVLLSVAAIVMLIHDMAAERSRKAIDRIHEEGLHQRRLP
jgi:hypothetical protein